MDSIPEFSGQHAVHGFEGLSPYECFAKFFPNSICNFVAVETNRYAKKVIEDSGELKERSRLKKWKEVESKDIKVLIAIEIGMGLVHKSELFSGFLLAN